MLLRTTFGLFLTTHWSDEYPLFYKVIGKIEQNFHMKHLLYFKQVI